MVRGPILDSRGQVIGRQSATERTNLVAARNFLGGLPDSDPNLSFIPMDRRGVAGLAGKYREMLETHVGIGSAVYWAITEGAALPKEICWGAVEPSAEELAFAEICKRAVIDDAVVYDGMVEGESALWSYPLLDAFIGFGLMFPRMLEGGGVEWYPVAHNAVMLWKPNGYLFGGARFSTPNGYDDLDADQLVHVVHGMANAGEFEGRSMLRDCLQPFELWKEIAINAGIYNQLAWGFLDISYEPSVSEDDIASFNLFGQQFQDGQRKYLLRPKAVDVDMRYPSGTPPAVIEQLEYWDRQIEKKLNAPLAGIAQFGSRAMAETLDGAAGRKAKAWLNSIFSRASRSMFRWLANQVGYEGRLPTVQVQSAELTSGIGGFTAYLEGVREGLISRAPGDEAWARRVIGAPELSVDAAAAEDLVESRDSRVAVAAQGILSSLAPGAPQPLSAEAARMLLVLNGMPDELAAALVNAQVSGLSLGAAPVAAAASAGVPISVDPLPATAPASVVVNGSVEVPAAIGESSAFAPVGAALADGEVDLTPTAGMAEAAARALEWRREFGRGGTAVGVARARDISNGRSLSADTVGRMASYFARHEVDKKGAGFTSGEDGFPSAGRIAWDLWGGDAGAGWAARKVAELERASSDAGDKASALAASLSDTPDVIVPDDVVAAAAAALAAHRALSKGRSSDSEAVLVARDLAAGKSLAWSRVMRMGEYFSTDYPRHVASKSFAEGGPSFHAYQLRGGDAARKWVRSLLVGYAARAHARAARLSDITSPEFAPDGDSEGPPGGVLVVGADGREFVTYRELRPEESCVGWVTLAESRADLDAELAASLDEIAAAHRAAVVSGLSDGWQAGERDRIYAEYVGKYQAALTSNAERLRASTVDEVLLEGKRAARSGVVGATASAVETAGVSAAFSGAASAQFANAAALTQKAGEEIADRVQGEVETALLTGADMSSWESRITSAGLMRGVSESRNVLEAASRSAAYASGAEVNALVPTTVIRSSIADSRRCDHCAAEDGKRYRVADYVSGGELALPPLPDPDCEGRARCRCGYIGLYERASSG